MKLVGVGTPTNFINVTVAAHDAASPAEAAGTSRAFVPGLRALASAGVPPCLAPPPPRLPADAPARYPPHHDGRRRHARPAPPAEPRRARRGGAAHRPRARLRPARGAPGDRGA